MVTSVRDNTRVPAMDESDEEILDYQTSRLQASRLRIALFNLLQSDNQKTRQTTLQKIFRLVHSYAITAQNSSFSPVELQNLDLENLKISGSPETADDDPNTAIPTVDHSLEAEGAAEQLHLYLLTLLRLTTTCPYSDVRRRCATFLNQLQTSGIVTPQLLHPSPSFFITEADITSFHSEAPTTMSSKLSPLSPSLSSAITGPRESHSDDITYQSTGHGDHWFHLQVYANPDEEVIGQPVDEYVWQIMAQMYLTSGRISNLCRVLAYFPTFYEAFHISICVVLKRSIGPLHPPWRYYLGIMAAAEHRCQYIVQVLTHEFVHHGGDKNWLKGLKHVPFKLRTISQLLLKVSRQPWKLQEEDMTQLMRHNSVGTPVSDTWTHSELVHATTIFATILSLSSFVGSCGIANEPDMTGGFTISGKIQPGIEQELGTFQTQLIHPVKEEDEAIHAASAATGWCEELDSHPSPTIVMQEDGPSGNIGLGLKFPVMKTPKEDIEDDGVKGSTESEMQDQTKMIISLLKETTQVSSTTGSSAHCLRTTPSKDPEGSPAKLHPIRRQSEDSSNTQTKLSRSINIYVNAVYENLDRFVDHSSASDAIERREFDIKVDEELNLGDFSWETEACDLVNHYLPSVGEFIDAEFHEALSITDWSIFNQEEDTMLDTSPLRRAIWFYCLKLYGVKKEDYDYSDIARLISPQMKKYLKKVCYDPQSITLQDWNTTGISLRSEEKCHMNVLASEAKKQALLCCMLSMLARL
ncbi:PA26 p53-induced protein-domain-containing protein [Umbelopsis sp. AD052]|nr:PA26 p53-induced protein-domain-containing protein [Umbelopsis sp. AD052]